MNEYQIYYVGTPAEVAHHAAPLEELASVRIADPADVVRYAGTNDLAIFFSEHFHRFREAWLQLKNKGCNTLYAIDGILEWRNAWENRGDEPACPWTMRPVLSDKVACIGASQARVLNGWGNQGKTEIVGIPRLDSAAAQTGGSKHSGRPQTENANTQTENFRVLVTTAKWPGFTPGQIGQVVRSLGDIKSHFVERPMVDGRQVEVIWRLTGELSESVGVENALNDLTGRELSAVLANVDAVITTPSTVMLEAMLADVPVCLLDYTNSPRYVDAAWSITAADQMESVISELARPTNRKRFYQRSILEDSLLCDGNASDRLIQLANEMIRLGHDSRQANRRVGLPPRILAPQPLVETLNTAELWPGNPQLVAGGQVEQCNAVAAESLRRVNHLQARIDLLECELARAAEGFDRIASHPVLAPLIKVRKMALGMGGHIAGILGKGVVGRKQDGKKQDRVSSNNNRASKVRIES